MANVALPAADYLPADQRAVGADRGGLRHVVAVVVAHQEDGVDDAEQLLDVRAKGRVRGLVPGFVRTV